MNKYTNTAIARMARMMPMLRPTFAGVVKLVLEDGASVEVAFESEDRIVGCGVDGIALWEFEGEVSDEDDGDGVAD